MSKKSKDDKPDEEVGILKYGDKDAKKRSAGRDLTPMEQTHLIAEYKRHRDTERAARAVGITFDNAAFYIQRALKRDPSIWEDKSYELSIGLYLEYISMEAMKLARQKLAKLDANKLAYTAKICLALMERYQKMFVENQGAAGTSQDEAELERILKEKQAELDRIEGDVTAGDNKANGTEDGPQAQGVVGKDDEA